MAAMVAEAAVALEATAAGLEVTAEDLEATAADLEVTAADLEVTAAGLEATEEALGASITAEGFTTVGAFEDSTTVMADLGAGVIPVMVTTSTLTSFPSFLTGADTPTGVHTRILGIALGGGECLLLITPLTLMTTIMVPPIATITGIVGMSPAVPTIATTTGAGTTPQTTLRPTAKEVQRGPRTELIPRVPRAMVTSPITSRTTESRSTPIRRRQPRPATSIWRHRRP